MSRTQPLWKNAVNGALRRAAGYELQRAGTAQAAAAPPKQSAGHVRGSGERLVTSPVFLLSPVRSGSTLLRVMLNTHSQICAPHEMHLRRLQVVISKSYAELSVEQSGLSLEKLEHLLWDRLLDRELTRSGKKLIVEKTPSNLLMWKRLSRAWPKARYVYLLRHPSAVADSWQRAHPRRSQETVHAEVLRYMEALQAARETLPGHEVRYEDLTTDPAGVLQGLCGFLRVPWEPAMLDYGQGDHGPLRSGIGDWSEKIQSGKVHAPAPPPAPADVHPALRPVAQAWGYLE